MPSEVNTLQPCQTSCLARVGEEGPYELFHGFCSSALFQSSPHAEAYLEIQNNSAGPKRKKRKSRKHQRVLDRRALLERMKLSRPKEEAGRESSTPTLVEMANSSAVWEEKSHCCQSNCRCPTTSRSANMFVDKHHLKLGKLKKALSESLPATRDSPDVHHLSIHGYDSGLSLPGSSASSRPASPCPPRTSPGKYIAIDCEMVGTGPGGRVSELARCSVVNYVGDVIYDKYIKPELPVFDYRTRWSGITRQHMKDAIPFLVAQKEITKILKDKIVIGHALYHDFRVLKYFHPSAQIRDTSKIPLLNQKAGLPVKATVSLKILAWHLLHKRIQVGREGHSSVEDAFTSMELYRLVQDQFEQDLMTNLWPSLPCHAPMDTSDNEHFMEDKYWPEELNENYT